MCVQAFKFDERARHIEIEVFLFLNKKNKEEKIQYSARGESSLLRPVPSGNGRVVK